MKATHNLFIDTKNYSDPYDTDRNSLCIENQILHICSEPYWQDLDSWLL